MPPKATPTAAALVDLTHTTRTLITHLQTSLSTPASNVASTATSKNISQQTKAAPTPPPILPTLKSATTLLRANTTTLSLLILTPPLTPSALYPKITSTTDVLLTMVACLTPDPSTSSSSYGELGNTVSNETRLAVRRVLSAWAELLGLVGRVAERKPPAPSSEGAAKGKGKVKEKGVEDADRAAVLAATGVVWESCEAIERIVVENIVGTVVRKAEEWRAVLLDAVKELKEWGEQAEDDEDGEGQEAVGSDGGYEDEDDFFGEANALGKGESAVRTLLERSVKKLKMVAMLYQAVGKRRLKTFPAVKDSSQPSSDEAGRKVKEDMLILDRLMALLKGIPETVDELASSFYDLDADEAGKLFEKICVDAVTATHVVEKSWEGMEDEFTAWAGKWREKFLEAE